MVILQLIQKNSKKIILLLYFALKPWSCFFFEPKKNLGWKSNKQTTGDDFHDETSLEIWKPKKPKQVDAAPSQPCGKKPGVSQELLETVKVTVLGGQELSDSKPQRHRTTGCFNGLLGRIFGAFTLPETNSSHLKMDGWNTTFLWGRPIFRGYVSFREGRSRRILVWSCDLVLELLDLVCVKLPWNWNFVWR